MLKIAELIVKKVWALTFSPFPFLSQKGKGWARSWAWGGNRSSCCPPTSRCRKSTFFKATPCWFPLACGEAGRNPCLSCKMHCNLWKPKCQLPTRISSQEAFVTQVPLPVLSLRAGSPNPARLPSLSSPIPGLGLLYPGHKSCAWAKGMAPGHSKKKKKKLSGAHKQKRCFHFFGNLKKNVNFLLEEMFYYCIY